MQGKVVSYLAYALALLAIVYCEHFYREPLYAFSLDFIKIVQANTNPEKIQFMMLVSDFGIASVFGMLVIAFLFCTIERAFYYTCVVSLNLYLMSIGKMGFHEPRPYMVDDDIQVFGCSTEFGQPSGHAFGSSAIILVTMFDILAHYSTDVLGCCSRFLIQIGSIFLISLVGYSRLHNGDHTWDQVILGW